jgi:hypothetical protein
VNTNDPLSLTVGTFCTTINGLEGTNFTMERAVSNTESKSLHLVAVNGNERIDIFLPEARNGGVYFFGDTTNFSNPYRISYATTSGDTYNSSNTAAQGSISLRSLAAGQVAGVFQFTGRNIKNLSDSIVVTDGKFNVKFTFE